MSFLAEQSDQEIPANPQQRLTWVEKGCLFHLAIFVFGCFGTCMPTGFAIMLGVLTVVDNNGNDWFRKNGREVEATIVRVDEYPHRRGVSYVASYEVVENGESRTYREASNQFAEGAHKPGDRIRVWVAGDRSRLVMPDGNVLRVVFWWPCLGPLICVPILAMIVYRRWKRYGQAVPS